MFDDTMVKQAALSSLLRYYVEGDFTQFDRISKLAGHLPNNDFEEKFLSYNLFQACLITGIIEVHETDSSLRWTSNNIASIPIQSNRPKCIPTEFSNIKNADITPAILNPDGYPLILANKLESFDKTEKPFSFDEKFFQSFMPPTNRVLDEMLFEEASPNMADVPFEVYNVFVHKWEHAREVDLLEDSLIRVVGDYAGREYGLYFPKKSLRFKVTYPEWAFICALVMLNWKFDEIFRFSGTHLNVPARFKLPVLFRRFLFANSLNCIIGRDFTFTDIDQMAFSEFKKYIIRMGN